MQDMWGNYTMLKKGTFEGRDARYAVNIHHGIVPYFVQPSRHAGI
jgi:hypothetical protein